MTHSFRFAIISDPHIAVPASIWDHPHRFHLVEVSIPAIEIALEHLAQLDLDFLLLPGDLTQHGEAVNHAWLSQRLAELPYPAYVVPGNHDAVERSPTTHSIGIMDFPQYYRKFGYEQIDRLYYTQEILPGVRLIGLNSIFYDAEGKQIGMGRVDQAQMDWLQSVLSENREEIVLVMIHHNVIEHLPGQSRHGLGRRYMLENAAELLQVLDAAKVPLIFTGHLHVQDVAVWQNIYEITTGSLVSYPHPYRVLQYFQDDQGQRSLQIETHRIPSVPGWENLQHTSREWMGDRSLPFMLKLLTQPPLNIPLAEAEKLAPDLRYFWADIAQGDQLFDFPNFPSPLRQHFQQFGAIDSTGQPRLIDNHTILRLLPLT
jgi:3',5'-cyclic AMP phosphodiesterase CpdA